MKNMLVLIFMMISVSVRAHTMQHGFIISNDDSYFDHLVATGHHSHQLGFIGTLEIEDEVERDFYLEEKKRNKNNYFLFQAQKLDLPSTHEGQILNGHIIESPKGDYQPQNIIVRKASLRVQKVLMNMPNPFFIEE